MGCGGAKIDGKLEDDCKSFHVSIHILHVPAKVFSTSTKVAPAANDFVFREYGLSLTTGYVLKSDLVEFESDQGDGVDDSDDEEEDVDEEREDSEGFKQEQQDEYEKLMEKLKIDGVSRFGA